MESWAIHRWALAWLKGLLRRLASDTCWLPCGIGPEGVEHRRALQQKLAYIQPNRYHKQHQLQPAPCTPTPDWSTPGHPSSRNLETFNSRDNQSKTKYKPWPNFELDLQAENHKHKNKTIAQIEHEGETIDTLLYHDNNIIVIIMITWIVVIVDLGDLGDFRCRFAFLRHCIHYAQLDFSPGLKSYCIYFGERYNHC